MATLTPAQGLPVLGSLLPFMSDPLGFVIVRPRHPMRATVRTP